MSTNLFETWFDSEMAKYRDDDDMIRALLRAKENMRTGFNAGLQYKEADTVGLRDNDKIVRGGLAGASCMWAAIRLGKSM